VFDALCIIEGRHTLPFVIVHRRMVVEFCLRVHKRLSQYSLRAQIIAYYNSIFRMLYAFPAIRFLSR